MPKIAAKDSNKNVTIAPHGTGKVVVGTGAADATVQSDGDHNLILQTGNSTTGKIEIADGANGNIDITPNGTGEVDIPKVDIDGGTVDGISLGTNSAVTEAQIDNINIDGNAITSTDDNGNIDLTPAGTGEVNISKVDIDGGAIDGTNVTVGSGKTLDVSAGSLTTSTTQKQAIVDGAEIEGTDILSTGESGSTKFLRENGTSPASWEEVGSASLPSQGGYADRLLTTDGSDASWTNAPINLVKLAFAGQSSAPDAPSAGTAYYNSTTNKLSVYNGTTWIVLNEPAGSVLQVKGDSYSKGSALTVTTGSERLLGTNLEVEITCKSTSNFLHVSTYLPNFYNNDTVDRCLLVGFRYSTDSFSSSDVDLGLEWIESRWGLFTPTTHHLQIGVSVSTWVAVPTISTIKIQVATQAYIGNVQIFTNASATAQTASLIVQEIQT